MLRILEISYEIFWIITSIIFYGVSLIPAYYTVQWGLKFSSPWFLFIFPTSFFIFLITLIIFTGLIKILLIPSLKPGKYDLYNDAHIYVWILNRWITEAVLIPFARIVFINDCLRYLTLKIYGADIKYSTMISTPSISDFSLIKIGSNTTIGAYTNIYPHLQPGKGKLILAKIIIGDSTFIGAESSIGCGVQIGDNSFAGFHTNISIFTTIGNYCNIGIFTVIGRRCIIEDNAVIGSHSVLGNNVTIQKGIKIRDNSIIPDGIIVDTQKKADAFSLNLTLQENHSEMKELLTGGNIG